MAKWATGLLGIHSGRVEPVLPRRGDISWMGGKPRSPVPSSGSKYPHIDHAIGCEANIMLKSFHILFGREVRLERALAEKTGRSNALHIASTKGAVTREVGSLFRYCKNAPTRPLMKVDFLSRLALQELGSRSEPPLKVLYTTARFPRRW